MRWAKWHCILQDLQLSDLRRRAFGVDYAGRAPPSHHREPRKAVSLVEANTCPDTRRLPIRPTP